MTAHVSPLRTLGAAAAAFLLAVLAGCAASVKERHYFATYEAESRGEPVNFFRVDVTADTQFTNARYVSGFYDERAVDLFFSELKASDQTLFKSNLTDPGTNVAIKPLDPGADGAFVMVLSTNADDIVNSISAFAESEVVGQAVTQIANKSQLQKAQASDAAAGTQTVLAAAFAAELAQLVQAASSATTEPAANSAYLRLLQRLATETGSSGQSFQNLGQALAWFQASQDRAGAQP